MAWRKMIRPLALATVLIMAGCASLQDRTTRVLTSSSPANVTVYGNPSFWEDFFLTIITFGLYENDTEDKVMIRKINDHDVHTAEAKIDPGPCTIGLVYSGDDGLRSRGMIVLSFVAEPGASYGIHWTAGWQEWSASLWNGETLAEANGEVFIPESWREMEDKSAWKKRDDEIKSQTQSQSSR